MSVAVANTSASGELALMDALGDAAALGSADGQRVLECTAALARLPGLDENILQGDWQTLLDALNKASAEPSSDYRMSEQRLEDGRRLIRLDTGAGEMQRYLAERDSLFLTSRTVSVSEMATALAHELNQPLGTLANLLGALKLRLARGEVPAETLEHAIHGSLDQTRFAQSVIERIRDFTASRRPEPKSLVVKELVDQSSALLDWLLLASGVTVNTHVQESVNVRGDETMLQQVLINLIRNAVEAMKAVSPEDRVIDVTIGVDAGRASLAIRDRGPGLDADPSAPFLPFVSGKADGMGVGLNICRSFLELHQGRLWLETHPEGGCVACIELPLERQELPQGDSE